MTTQYYFYINNHFVNLLQYYFYINSHFVINFMTICYININIHMVTYCDEGVGLTITMLPFSNFSFSVAQYP